MTIERLFQTLNYVYNNLITIALMGGYRPSEGKKRAKLYEAQRWSTRNLNIVDRSVSLQRKDGQADLFSISVLQVMCCGLYNT